MPHTTGGAALEGAAIWLKLVQFAVAVFGKGRAMIPSLMFCCLFWQLSVPLPSPPPFFFLRRRRFREGLQWRSITLCEVEIKEEGYTMKLCVKGMITGRAKSG